MNKTHRVTVKHKQRHRLHVKLTMVSLTPILLPSKYNLQGSILLPH